MDKKVKRLGWKKWLVIGVVVVIGLGITGGLGLHFYRPWRQKRSLEKARTYLSWKDFNQAGLMTQRVLQFDPKNIEAARLMVEIAEAVESPVALNWQRRVMELQPERLENHLELAKKALAFGKPSIAKEALESAPASREGSSLYHDLHGKVALALNDREAPQIDFEKAVQLAPDNADYALDLATLRLESASKESQDAARLTITNLLQQPSHLRRASLALIGDAIRRKDGSRAVALAAALISAPSATFEDHLANLTVLHQFDPRKFPSYLTAVQDQAAQDRTKLYGLISWMNANGCALLAVEWSKRLPSAVVQEMPVPIAVAQSYATLGDWEGLKPIVSGAEKADADSQPSGTLPRSEGRKDLDATAEWKNYEFMRLALLARSLRGTGQAQESTVRWNDAVQAAAGRSDALQVLARAAIEWKWEKESMEVLWLVAEKAEGDAWALDLLFQRYAAVGSTRNLLRVASRLLELDPTNPLTQNNFAALSFLLNTNMDQALKLSGALYAKEPANPGYASTYAFGLHLHGRSDEALKIFQKIDEAKRSEPSYAAYYGVILAAMGSPDAAKYLTLASGAALLPEEAKMVEEARSKRRGSSAVRPDTTEN